MLVESTPQPVSVGLLGGATQVLETLRTLHSAPVGASTVTLIAICTTLRIAGTVAEVPIVHISGIPEL